MALLQNLTMEISRITAVSRGRAESDRPRKSTVPVSVHRSDHSGYGKIHLKSYGKSLESPYLTAWGMDAFAPVPFFQRGFGRASAWLVGALFSSDPYIFRTRGYQTLQPRIAETNQPVPCLTRGCAVPLYVGTRWSDLTLRLGLRTDSVAGCQFLVCSHLSISDLATHQDFP